AMEYTRCPAHQGGAPGPSYLRIEPGPSIPVARPARRGASGLAPARKPGLILDLDPKVQPLAKDGKKD
ncbi:MAG TPA: ribonuclease T, partial [Sphingobium sp.]|nr:ribonuclease T [Sphingobium sp.]